MEHEGDGETSRNWLTWNNPQILVKRLAEMELKEQMETNWHY